MGVQILEPHEIAASLKRQSFAAELFWAFDVFAIGYAPVFVAKRVITHFVHAAKDPALLPVYWTVQVDAESFLHQGVQSRLQDVGVVVAKIKEHGERRGLFHPLKMIPQLWEEFSLRLVSAVLREQIPGDQPEPRPFDLDA